MADPYFNARDMLQGTTDAESIFNEFKGYVPAAFGRLLSRTVSDPPGGPSTFDAYLVPAGAINGWAGLDGNIVFYLDDWIPMPVQLGMRAYIADEDVLVEFHNAGGTTLDATLGNQLITPVFESGAWRIYFDVSKGNIGHAVLSNNTILMAPTNMQPGRRYVLRLEQDGVGSHTATLETPDWASVGGAALVDIDTTALRVTDVIIQGPSESLDVPAVHSTVKDLRVVTP